MSPTDTSAVSSTRETVNGFIAAWNAHSPEGVSDVFAPEGRLWDPSAPDGITGPAIAASVRRTLERVSEAAFAVSSVLDAGDGRVAFEWRMSGILAAPDGRSVPVQLTGCDVCHVRDLRWDYVFVGWPSGPGGIRHPVRAELAGTEAREGVAPSDHYAVLAELRY